MCQMVSVLSWQNFLIITTDTQYFCSNVLLLVPWKAAELAVLTDVPMVGDEAVGAEALLCHFWASFAMEWQYSYSVQDTKGVVETSKVLSSSLKGSKCIFQMCGEQMQPNTLVSFSCSQSMCRCSFQFLRLLFSPTCILVLTPPLFP